MANVQTTDRKKLWGGAAEPFMASYGKVMMWFFLVSDCFSFSGLLITYGSFRFSNPTWPDPNQVFNAMPFMHSKVPLGFVSIMTFILILSSVFVVRAVQEGKMMNRKGVVMWMIGAILGGAAFLGCQAWEWTHLIQHGMTLHTPIHYELADGTVFHGPKLFGQLFFLITGFHGFHVLTGVIINILVTYYAAKGVYEKRGHYEMIEKVGLYWHFVDLVWVFVFLLFYLI